MFYCGIDIAKYKHEATVRDEAGAALLDSISFANSKEGCGKLLALFQRLDISKEDLLIGMEATGHYWLSVYGYLLEQGFEVKVINPIQSEAFRKMYIRQTKNDRKDSFIIAQIMRFGQFSATNLSEEVIVAMRQLSRYRLALVDACGDCKRRVIALLDQVFPEYDTLFSDTFGVTSKEVLSQYPTPEDMLTVSTRKLTTLLEKASHGRFGKEKAEQLFAEFVCIDFVIIFQRPARLCSGGICQYYFMCMVARCVEDRDPSAERVPYQGGRFYAEGCNKGFEHAGIFFYAPHGGGCLAPAEAGKIE